MLRLHFRETSHEHTPTAAALVLGQVAHAALESAVHAAIADGSFVLSALDHHWEDAVARIGSQAALPAEDVMRMPGYQVKRARMRRVAQTLGQLLRDVQPVTEVLTEGAVRDDSGQLRGRIDLALRSASGDILVDYKTGSISGGAGSPEQAYVQQLKLYAYMYASTYDGRWPVQAHLVALTGELVTIPVLAPECEALARGALLQFEQYRSSLPNPPAAPSVSNCRLCPYAPRCAAFWSAIGSGWAKEILAVKGHVIETYRAGDTLVTARLAGCTGSIGDDESEVLVRAIDGEAHPAARLIHDGMVLAAAGLYKEPGRESYALSGIGRIAVTPSNNLDPQ